MMATLSRYTLGVILVVGVVVRLVFVVVNLEFRTLPQGGADAVHFERSAWGLSQFGQPGLLTHLLEGESFIILLGSYVYDLTGRVPYALALIMACLGTGVIYLAYRAALELWEDVRIARMV